MSLPRLRLVAACLGCTAAVLLHRQAENSKLPQGPYWPLALGSAQDSATTLRSPANFSKALDWSWHHPGGKYHTTIAGGPVIDDQKNLYLTTNDGIRKLSADGETLWWYRPPGDTNNQPSLMGGLVYGNTNNGFGFAVDQATGKEVWKQQYEYDAGGDVGYPGGSDGVYVMGVKTGTVKNHGGGNQRVIGIDGKTGQKLWDYKTEWPVWNLMPLFPGEDSVVFMDFTGGVYRLGLHNGTELWHARAPDVMKEAPSFSDGGVTVADGKAFACSNPKTSGGSEGTQGVLRAFRLTDGLPLWARTLPQPCNSWPAVGRLGDGPELSVVVTPGSFMGSPVMHGGIMAFDAGSGSLQWKWQAPPFAHLGNMAVGDLEGYFERKIYDPRHPICLPAHWSAPLIMGDGAVLAGRSDGVLYKLRAPPQHEADLDTSRLPVVFETSPGVTVEDKFDAQGASLHGALAAAPGMLAFATCTDSLFVFKY